MGDSINNATVYSYQPLTTPSSFRLLRFISNRENQRGIHCTLSEFDRRDPRSPAYTALSYAWGNVGTVVPITLNERLTFVTENLHDALLHLRNVCQDTFLWIDALSINQGDPSERGHQVSQMRAIYSQASDVISWLGPGNPQIDRLFPFIWTHHHECTLLPQETCSHTADRDIADALLYLEERPYWNRIWIIQEMVVATRLTIMCGDNSVPWNIFTSFWPLIFMQHFPKAAGMNRSLAPPYHSSAILYVRAWRRSDISLSYAIELTGLGRASDARDKVYALLGLVDKGAGRDIVVDYTVPACAVYLVATKALISDWRDNDDGTAMSRQQRLEELLYRINAMPALRKENKARSVLLECQTIAALRQHVRFMLGLEDYLDVDVSFDHGTEWTATCDGDACGSWAAMWKAATIHKKVMGQTFTV